MKERKKKVSSGCRWYLLEAFSWCEVFHVSLFSFYRIIYVSLYNYRLHADSFRIFLCLWHIRASSSASHAPSEFFCFLFYLSLSVFRLKPQNGNTTAVFGGWWRTRTSRNHVRLTIRMERIFLGINPAEGGEDKVSRKRGIDCRHVKE